MSESKPRKCPKCGLEVSWSATTCPDCGAAVPFTIDAGHTTFVTGEQTLAAAVVYLILKTRDRTLYESQDERVEESELLRRAAKMAGRGDNAYESPFELCRDLLNLFEGPRG